MLFKCHNPVKNQHLHSGKFMPEGPSVAVLTKYNPFIYNKFTEAD